MSHSISSKIFIYFGFSSQKFISQEIPLPILKKFYKMLIHMVLATYVLFLFLNLLTGLSGRYSTIIHSLTSFLELTERIVNTMLNSISEASSIIKQLSKIYLNTSVLPNSLVTRIERFFW